MTSYFKFNLYNILEALDKVEIREVTLNKGIQSRLDISLEQYKLAMRNMYNYVTSRDTLKVLKAISKLNPKGDNQHDN